MNLTFTVNTEFPHTSSPSRQQIQESSHSFWRLTWLVGSNLPWFLHADWNIRPTSGSLWSWGTDFYNAYSTIYYLSISPACCACTSGIHKRMSKGREEEGREGRKKGLCLLKQWFSDCCHTRIPWEAFKSPAPRPHSDKAECCQRSPSM